jgi:hypothetical protein
MAEQGGVGDAVLVIGVTRLLAGGVTGGGKLLWVLLVLYLPILGSVAWFVAMRPGSLHWPDGPTIRSST